MKRILYSALCGTLMMCMAACGSSKVTTTADLTNLAAEAYVAEVIAHASEAEALCAKAKMNLVMGGNEMGVSGNLRMLKDDVIQITLVGFGIIEAGRIEFTREYVMVVDRINKQFVKVPYAEADFLAKAGVDFYTLQAIFWNELTLPGTQHITAPQASQFEVTPCGQQTLLTDKGEGVLSYRFYTAPATAHNERTEIGAEGYQLCCDYADFATLGAKEFPNNMTLSVVGGKKNLSLAMRLSSVNNSGDWERRTTVSSKYKEVAAADLFAKLMGM